jgi:hypothetical protein
MTEIVHTRKAPPRPPMAPAMLTDRRRPQLGREFGAYITNPIFLSRRLDYLVKNKPNLLFQKTTFGLPNP